MFYVVLLIAVMIVAFAARMMWHGLQTAAAPAMTDDVRRARGRFLAAARRLARSDRSARWEFGGGLPSRG